MIAYPTRSQRFAEARPLSVGVFEDDALLLRLATRSRLMESNGLRVFTPIDPNELAFEAARLAAYATWDL